MTKNEKLNNLLTHSNEILVAPGAANALTAHLIEEAGFPAVYITGAGLSNQMLGLADVGLISFKEVLDQVKYIADAVDIPVIADADTGFGNAINVVRTVKEFEHAGVSAIQLEDQITPKKCGHFSGKQIVSTEEMEQKIKAATETRKDTNFKIIARTDARALKGIDAAIERAEKYIEAGADLTFVEAPQTTEEMKKIITRLPHTPQIANMVEHGLTPLKDNKELQDLGYRIVLYANFLQRRSIKAMQDALLSLKQENTTQHMLDDMISMKERNRLTHLQKIEKLEEKYLKID
ncbi:isocitrate lyase/PEP mutase family protein [Salsuginibacillus kocurii]|uniref:isocitrate lyase/PEP mutase family protein n=1 Tax=Salsuginibacillus kocurii TaxID=427078 RepID=UPI00035C5C0A|nr:isocitrate lyase/PEP mutase family protein [Salsuginibacillus kocurii]